MRLFSPLNNTTANTVSLIIAGFILTASTLPVYADNLLIPRIGLTTNSDKVLTVQRTLPQSEIKTSDTEEATDKDKDDKDSKKKKKDSFVKRWMEKKQKAAENAPVNGDYFLYDLKNKRLMYREEGHTNQKAEHKFLWFGKKEDDKITQNQVAFDKPIPEGLYTVVVQGSGHEEQTPIWISDSIYWEAIKPVIRDISSYHCPHLKGHFQTIQSCYAIQVETNNPVDIYGDGSTKLVKGGWYTGEMSNGTVSQVKDTKSISKITNALLNLYALNPGSYEYLEIKGVAYQQSPLPDLLDEANWGLQYLLSIQDQETGGFPSGIEQQNFHTYTLENLSPDATAYAISAMTQGADQYKKTDMAFSIQLIKASEKAWQYLSTQSTSNELKFMALASLANATQNNNYTTQARQYLPGDNIISSDTAFMLGSRLLGAKAVVPAETIGTVPTEIVPYLNQLAEQPDKTTYSAVAKFVENLYGYEEVAFKPNISYKVASAVKDPLAFLAFKSGVVLTKVGNSLEGSNIISGNTDVPKEFLQELEKKQNDAIFLSKKGYSEQNMSLLDKAYLAFTLGLLNQNVGLLQPELSEKQKKKLENTMPADEQVLQRPKLPANLPTTVPN